MIKKWVAGMTACFWPYLLALVPSLVSADGHDSIPPFVVAIPSYGTLKIAVNGHCLDYGLPFPGTTISPVEVAADEIRLAIVYSLAQGYYTEENLEQVQWAIWHFTNGVDITGDDDALARRDRRVCRERRADGLDRRGQLVLGCPRSGLDQGLADRF